MAIEMWPTPSGGKWQTQQSVEFKELATVWESCTRPLSFEEGSRGDYFPECYVLRPCQANKRIQAPEPELKVDALGLL